MKRRLPDFWFAVAVIVFLVSLAGMAYMHQKYVVAENAYEFHLSHVVFSPHAHISATLQGYAQATSSRLRAQTILLGITLLATTNILVQVVRRRNNRVAIAVSEDTGAESSE